METDPRRNLDNLRDHLLGPRGLLARTAQRIEEQGRIPAPKQNTGSFIPSGPKRKKVLGDGSDLPLIDLAENLRDWMGLGPLNIAAYLIRHGVTDHYIASALLDNVRERVRFWATENRLDDAHTDHLLRLIATLQAWLGTNCAHSFRPIDATAEITTLSCESCSLTIQQYGDQETRFQVPHARCAWCDAPMEQALGGRERRFCSDACRMRRNRAA